MAFYKLFNLGNSRVYRLLSLKESTIHSSSYCTTAQNNATKKSSEPSTHFGFETVPESEKEQKGRGFFRGPDFNIRI